MIKKYLSIDDEMPLSGLFSNADEKIEIKYVYSRGSRARLSQRAGRLWFLIM